jgi:hypothetical protein
VAYRLLLTSMAKLSLSFADEGRDAAGGSPATREKTRRPAGRRFSALFRRLRPGILVIYGHNAGE